MAEWMGKKACPHAADRRLTSEIKSTRPKVKERKTMFHANGNKKKAGAVTLMPDNTEFTAKAPAKDKEGHCTAIK